MPPRLALALLLPLAAHAADVRLGDSFEGREAITLSNGVLELTVLPFGGPLASVKLADDRSQMNPMWQALAADREAGRPLRNSGSMGHFVCVDGFGPVSDEEAAAGLSGHGEASDLIWSTVSASDRNGIAALVQSVRLPIHHEIFTRTITMRDGENVVRVHGELESLLAFDRPAVWAEHATIGSPFLERGTTVVDISPSRAMVRPRPKPVRGRNHRLQGGEEFDWPMAPTRAGGTVDLRAAPLDDQGGTLDHTGHLMTRSGEYAWVTALRPDLGLVLGYVFQTSEFPWLQTWESYPAEGRMARGLEFGTQAFDLPRRQIVSENRLFGQLLYRWLPAKSKIEATYLMFWARAPAGFEGVSRIDVERGRLVLTDDRSGGRLELPTRLTLD